jgi:uncharacterized membrane protein
MNALWGIPIILVGLFMLFSGMNKSTFVVYRLMVARSRPLWNENVHLFYQVVGGIIVIVGIAALMGLL